MFFLIANPAARRPPSTAQAKSSKSESPALFPVCIQLRHSAHNERHRRRPPWSCPHERAIARTSWGCWHSAIPLHGPRARPPSPPSSPGSQLLVPRAWRGRTAGLARWCRCGARRRWRRRRRRGARGINRDRIHTSRRAQRGQVRAARHFRLRPSFPEEAVACSGRVSGTLACCYVSLWS